jgi:hypothetical protein
MTACDVLVAGGGSAGIAAAVAAARAGAETVLIERGGMLGGMGSSAFVHTVCGLYQLREEPGAVYANEGFAPEFARRLLACGGARQPVRMGRLDVLPHDPVMFAAEADEIVTQTPRLRVWLHAEMISAHQRDGRIAEAEIICRGRRALISAKSFVDATGDAALTALAKAAFGQAEPGRLQRPACLALLRGVAPESLAEEGRLRMAHAIATAVRAGELPVEALGAGFRAGFAPDEAFLTMDLAGDGADGVAWDPFSAEMLARVEFTGRHTALALARFFKCRVVAWPARAGVRESRRVTGVHELTGDEVLGGAQFGDGVVNVAWPVELRERTTGPRWRYPDGVLPAQIPLRSLRHRDVPNLWTAGRCISASHEAQAAIRVMGTCFATGEIAGLAAVAATAQGQEWDWPGLAAGVISQRDNLRRTP